jgi:type VI secretion system protein ImpL
MAKVKLPKPKILAISVPALILLVVMTWLIGNRLAGLPTWIAWTVRGLIMALGVAAIALVLKLFKGSGPPAARAEPDVVDGLIEQATKRLNALGLRGRRALSGVPIVVVLGPRGSAKTTFVARSDLDADLLAGNLPGETAVPTDGVNVWYRSGQVLVEAGGQLSVDPGRWGRLVERLKPRQLLPALLGRPQSPRVAVVCFSVEDLLTTGSGDSHLAAARTLRSRLTELAERIGIRLPVYVVFTKTDRVPHFEEFARNLNDAEVHDILGTTVRSGAEGAAGSYAERESERLSRALEELFHGLAERRLELLGRAGVTQGNGAAYEFPREFRKLSKPAIQFLVELCRPSQLRVSPFLRGFYFTGVRPIVARDDVPQSLPSQAFGQAAAAGATQVFRLDDLQPKSTFSASPLHSHERRVPQWVYLDRILQRVVLMDRVAMGITSSGVGLSVLRRAAMAAAVGVLLFLGMSAVIAYRNDSALQREARLALEGVTELSTAPAGLSSAEPLQRLDSLRAVTEKLAAFEHEGRPLRSKIFMYSGGRVYEQSRRAYFHLFRSLLFDRAFERLKADLRQLPSVPNSEQFDMVYRSLKAYVEITEPLYHDSATAEFFGPVLTSRWLGISAPDEQTRALLQRQFAFYGAELPYESPFSVEATDINLTNGARAFLSANTNDDSFYARLLGQWSRLPAGRIEVDRPETMGFLRPASEVHGAYTRVGWDSVRASLANTDRTFSMHVVGPEFFQSLTDRGFELETLPQRLQTRYEESYRDEWLRFLAEAQLERRELAQAQSWLTELAGNRSALFRLFAYVDSQTHVGAPVVDSTFSVLSVLTGPDTLPLRISEKPGLEYLGQLRSLSVAVGGLAAAPGAAASDEVRRAASQGSAFVDGIAVNFPVVHPGAGATSDAVTSLLKEPFVIANQYAGGTPGLVANGKAQVFCQRWGQLVFERFPFRRGAPEAAVADVDGLLNSASGALNPHLQEVDQLGASLTPQYEAFRMRARDVASAFYQPPGAGPRFSIFFLVNNFTGIERVDVTIDAQTETYTISQQGRRRFDWNAATAAQVLVRVQAGGRPVELEYAGPWALFRFFEAGAWQDQGGGRYLVTWPLTGESRLQADVQVAGAPLLNPAYLTAFGCPRTIAR